MGMRFSILKDTGHICFQKVAYSPSGEYFASGMDKNHLASYDKTIRLWDAMTAIEIR